MTCFCAIWNCLIAAVLFSSLSTKVADSELVILRPMQDSGVYVRRGNSLVLQCGEMTNITLVIWRKPDNVTVPYGSGSENSEKTLIVWNTTAADSGSYSCTAYSLDGVQYNATSEVIVQDVPDPPSNVSLVSHLSTGLFASWTFGEDHKSSIHLHTIYLYKTDTLIQEVNVSAPLNTTTFVGLQAYRCYHIILRALNDVGWSSFTRPFYALTSRGKPEVQPQINVHNISRTSVILRSEHSKLLELHPLGQNTSECGDSDSHLQSLLRGPLSSYVVYVSTVKPHRLVGEHVFPVLPDDDQLLTIPNLRPYTHYNISVAFRNGKYQGPLAQRLVQTAEGEPDQPVITKTSATNTSITVWWRNGPYPGGEINQYKLELYPCGANQKSEPDKSLRLRMQQIGWLKQEFTFGVLDPNSCYALRIASGTRAGFGPFTKLHQIYTDIPAPKPPELLSATFLDSNDILLNWTCLGLCANFIDQLQYTICWLLPQLSVEPSCLRTQTFNSAHQAFCNCGVSQNFQSTVLPWSIVQHSKSEKALFTVRSVRKREVCPPEGSCEVESVDSNTIPLDLRSAPAHWRMNSNSNFKLDNTAILSITSITLLVFASVTLAACFANRLKCMLLLCQRSVFCRRSTETPSAKYRRAVPLRLNKTTYKPIPRSELRAYVAAAHADNDAGFQAEFEAIERTVSSDWTTNVAKLSENMSKNRYSNVLAYDHTRVILKEVGRKSDYINANYIDGYHRRAAYIAAQGPIPATFDDFWLMVWEQSCNVIVMISNFIERGRRKCDKYWPTSGQQLYGNISVRMVSETVRAFFTIRVFVIRHVRCKRGSKERLIYHYQYTDWRDFDVPTSPLPVLKFVETSIARWSLEDGPIVVHCSAGVGRTGTYICIESLIRQLKVEHVVTIRSFLEHIRQQRMKLVQTEQQYAFIHDALREHVLHPCHTIRPTHFADYLQHLRELDSSGRSNLEKQYEMCIVSPSESTDMSRSTRTLTSMGRRGSCSLYGTTDVLGINSSTLHGYHMLSEYIVARHPLAGTETEFWKMVWDQNSSIIVCLSGLELPPFWPQKANEVRDIGWLHVSYAGSRAYSDAVTRFEFLLTSDREDYALACTLWRFSGWPSVAFENTAELNLAHALLDLATHVVDDDDEDLQGSTGPIVVVDNSGGNRVGTFCALRILINQLTHEFLFDVYFVFKMLCVQRPRMFQSHLDLEFVYTLLQQYLSRDVPSSLCNSGVSGAAGTQGTVNSIFGLPSPSRVGSRCRRRTKVMVNHLFPHRNKTSLLCNNSPHALGSEAPMYHPRPPSLLTADGDKMSSLINSIADEQLSEANRSTLPSTGVLESISHESLAPSISQPSLSRTGSMNSHSRSPAPCPDFVFKRINMSINELFTFHTALLMSTREAPAAFAAIRNPNSLLASMPQRPALSDAALFSIVLTVRETGRRLAMSDYAVATACTILHRALRVLLTGDEQPNNPSTTVLNGDTSASPEAIDQSFRHSLGDIDPYTIAMACISLGGKVQEEHQRLRDVIVAFYRSLHKNRRPALEVGDDYDRLRESLVQTELFLMRLLAFHVRRPSLPHPYLVHYLHSLLHWVGKGIAQPCGGDLTATGPSNTVNAATIALARLPGLAWSILADSYHSPICLDFSPEHIAAAILHLALRIAGVEIPGNRHSEMAWWQAISDSLTREIVEQIQLRVMEIYAVDDKLKNSMPHRYSDDF
ncbi:Tyrosine-protein phosphatase 99A [Clonorchis sinensis]|uniref:protein-tyrosine-phosphatase n=1 Tax=Clonorchis sinensis TaxID=79923 RepID=A0A8T1MJJ8_CLOSI|nr:Tyrosine-protein phosphatase 99A [Clonorchis sinensis]